MKYKATLRDYFYVYEVCICTTCMLCVGRPEESVLSSGIDCCELPCRCWESDFNPPEEQSVLLTANHLSSLKVTSVAMESVLELVL